jgi:PAP2 superfamily
VREVAMLGALYVAYEGVRLAVQGGRPLALAHGERILALERRWHIAVDPWLNAELTVRPALAIPACFAYASLHNLVTLSVLGWLWLRRSAAYPAARTALVVTTLLGLAGFWLVPVAPPRMLPGFTDTMLAYGDYGWWGSAADPSSGLAHLTNQFAAMPSLHVGWAAWCGWYVLRLARRWWPRVLGAGYPVLISVVVIGTANHYLLDVVAGMAVLAAGVGCAQAFRATPPRTKWWVRYFVWSSPGSGRHSDVGTRPGGTRSQSPK